LFATRWVFLVKLGETLGLSCVQRTFNDLSNQITAKLELGRRHPEELEQTPSFQKFLSRKEQQPTEAIVGRNVASEKDRVVSVSSVKDEPVVCIVSLKPAGSDDRSRLSPGEHPRNLRRIVTNQFYIGANVLWIVLVAMQYTCFVPRLF